jgi:hypothetical protein
VIGRYFASRGRWLYRGVERSTSWRRTINAGQTRRRKSAASYDCHIAMAPIPSADGRIWHDIQIRRARRFRQVKCRGSRAPGLRCHAGWQRSGASPGAGRLLPASGSPAAERNAAAQHRPDQAAADPLPLHPLRCRVRGGRRRRSSMDSHARAAGRQPRDRARHRRNLTVELDADIPGRFRLYPERHLRSQGGGGLR